MKKKVCISGPILGVENDQCYRKTITKICVKRGFDFVEPWRSEQALYEGNEQCWWNNVPPGNFTKKGLDDALRCDMIIAFLQAFCRSMYGTVLRQAQRKEGCGGF